jgi:hypothetical protein
MMQAAGRLGWSEKQFRCSTPRFLANALRGANEDRLFHTRTIAFYAVQPLRGHVDGRKWPFKQPADLFALPGEKPLVLGLTLEELQARRERLLQEARKIWGEEYTPIWNTKNALS